MTRQTHPSGKPVRERRIVARGWTNMPPAEPLTPGLRKRIEQTNAIGFTAEISASDDD